MRVLRSWLWLPILALLALGIARLRFDVEILNLLPEKLPAVKGLKFHQSAFSDSRELILTVSAPTPEAAESTARSLARVLETETNLVADVLWQPSWLENPALATELVASIWLNQPPEVFEALTNRLAPAHVTEVLKDSRERLATSLSPTELGIRGYDPFGLLDLPPSASAGAPVIGKGEEVFVAPDGKFRLVFIQSRYELTSYRDCQSWLSQMDRLITEAKNSGKLSRGSEIHYTGRPAFVTEISASMENDMAGSAGGTLAVIGILFWLTHRRLRPLLWLLLILLVVLAGTTAMGGLLLGKINVVSMGFASILLGLSEDFGIVIYQEARSHPQLNARDLRREVAPGIFWSAVTTAGAFAALNLSSLPGLGQLGSLVAIGIMLSAAVMLYGYLPPMLRLRRARDRVVGSEETAEHYLLFSSRPRLHSSVLWAITCVLLGVSLTVILQTGFRFDASPNVLRPKNSIAYATLEEIKQRFSRGTEPVWVLAPGKNETEVMERLVAVGALLAEAKSNHLINSYALPTSLWPQPEHQRANRHAATSIIQDRERLRKAAAEAGFTPQATLGLDSLCEHWQRALESTDVFWPSNRVSRWILGKVASRSTNGFLALGMVEPTSDPKSGQILGSEFASRLEQQGVLLSGWKLLGSDVFTTVLYELPRMMIPIFLLVSVSLWLAFRSVKEVLLSLATLAFSGLCLNAGMILLRWDWNLLNLMALPLLLGMGVDFSIHIQLAMRRYQGDLQAVRRSVGRALLLAGATTVAGFVSLTFSTSEGMASLGRVCALGIAIALIIAVYLMPVWWRFFILRSSPSSEP